jgi:arylsulfatase A-like enzyme
MVWAGLHDALKDMGLLDDTLLVVTADHGHSIGDEGYMGKRPYPADPEVF